MLSSAMDVSIVIATCGRGPMLRETLDHLLSQAEALPFHTEFVIVDDCSTDSTPDVLREFQRRAQVPVTIVRGEGVGMAAARNLCVVHSRGTWLACCDDDQIPAPNWLFSLYEAALLSSADFVGGSMYLRLPFRHPLNGYGPRARRLLGEFGVHRSEGFFPPGEFPTASNVLMRAEAVCRLGAFNTGFTEGGEDTDLFHRARAAGYTFWFAPRARMQHRPTERRVTPQGLRRTAMRIASGNVRMMHLRSRNRAPLRHAAARSAVLLLRDLPQFAFTSLLRRPSATLDVQCSMWYTEGVLRSLPRLIESPGSRALLRRMDFRQREGERVA